jgi:hypothetical protein
MSVPRRAPHCRTCGQPKKGHPRSCPGTEDAESRTPSVAPSRRSSEHEREFERLRIKEDEEEKASIAGHGRRVRGIKRRQSDNTLNLLQAFPASTSASNRRRFSSPPHKVEIIDVDAEDDEEEERKNRVASWRDALLGPDGLFVVESDGEETETETARRRRSRSRSFVKPPPLRMPDDEGERKKFLHRLEGSARGRTRVYELRADELGSAEEEAKHRGFVARAYTPPAQAGDGDKSHGYLVLGEEKEAVDRLTDRLARETERPGVRQCVAAGAVLGAVATWVGLSS